MGPASRPCLRFKLKTPHNIPLATRFRWQPQPVRSPSAVHFPASPEPRHSARAWTPARTPRTPSPRSSFRQERYLGHIASPPPTTGMETTLRPPRLPPFPSRPPVEMVVSPPPSPPPPPAASRLAPKSSSRERLPVRAARQPQLALSMSILPEATQPASASWPAVPASRRPSPLCSTARLSSRGRMPSRFSTSATPITTLPPTS